MLRRIAIILVCTLCVQVAGAAQRPNIVLIVADDIGFSDFGTFGGEIDTPHIDSLAREGVRFSNFHTASSCAPTRAMLLTGVDHHLAGLGNMRESMPMSHRGEPGYEGILNERVVTIATYLQSAGYRTTAAGKWHLGHDSGSLPVARGFDYSIVQNGNGSDNFEMRPYLPLRPEVFWYENGKRLNALPDNFYSSTYFVDKTIAFLESGQSEDTPFFAYIAFQANHTPIQAPAEFIDRYRGHYAKGWARVREARIERMIKSGIFAEQAIFADGPDDEAWNTLPGKRQYYEARRMQAYAGMATAMDHEVGRLIAYLRDTGQYANTVFVVLSDNGATLADPYQNRFASMWLESNYHHEVETLGERGSWISSGPGWGRVSNTPFSGAKFSAGEGGVRVPLIVSGLGLAEPDAVFNGFVYVTDIAPTLLEVAGVEPLPGTAGREPISGKSLLNVLETGAVSLHDESAAIGYEFAGNSALYQGDYKLVRNRPPAGDGEWRLFQISTDPGETADLSEELPRRFAAMKEHYSVYVSEVGVLKVPEGYVLEKQAAVNALVFYYLPRYLPVVAFLLVIMTAGAVVYFRRRRRRRRRARRA